MAEPLASKLLDGEFSSCGARDLSPDTNTYLFSHFHGSLFGFVSQPRHRRSKSEDLRSCPLDTSIQYKKSEGPFDVESRLPSLAVVLRQFFVAFWLHRSHRRREFATFAALKELDMNSALLARTTLIFLCAPGEQ